MAHFAGGSTKNFLVATAGQANQFWVPEIYSKKVQLALRKASTVEAICNTDYMGEIKNFGDTVNIVKEPEMSVAAYTRGLTPLVNTTVTDQELVLIIDKANYFHFQIDSLEKRFGHINFQEIASNNAAYKLKDTMDAEVMQNMYDDAHAATATLTPIIAGGVAANTRFRYKAEELSLKNNLNIYFPSMQLCTDNAGMIAMAGYEKISNNLFSNLDLEANPNLSL